MIRVRCFLGSWNSYLHIPNSEIAMQYVWILYFHWHLLLQSINFSMFYLVQTLSATKKGCPWSKECFINIKQIETQIIPSCTWYIFLWFYLGYCNCILSKLYEMKLRVRIRMYRSLYLLHFIFLLLKTLPSLISFIYCISFF